MNKLSISAIALAIFIRLRKDALLPYGAASSLATKFGGMDYTNNSMLKKGKLKKIYERLPESPNSSSSRTVTTLVKGPESPVIHPQTGTLYVMTEEANLVSLTDFQESVSNPDHITAKATLITHLGIGRPLGAAFTRDGETLYIADALLGLTRVSNVQGQRPIVELVASKVVDENGKESRFAYANDVAVGPKTGHVYFTDSSDIQQERKTITGFVWDTMTAYKRDYLRGKKTGRLLRYKPETGEVDILARDIWFANGVAVDKDETFIMISETSSASQLKYHLQGSKRGSLDVMVDKLPGLPDGAICSSKSGLCYAPLPSLPLPIMTILAKAPNQVSAFVRSLLIMLPSSAFNALKPVSYGGVVEILPARDSHSEDQITRILQDPHGETISLLTGVDVFDNKLYMGSLKNPFVGVFDLNDE